MVKIIRNFFSVLRLFHVLAKYRILTSKYVYLPKYMTFFCIFYEILIFPRYVFSWYNNKDFDKNLIKCVIELGPIYIKFCQTLSTRADLIGKSLSTKLRLLHDKLDPYDTKIVQQKIFNNIGKNVEEIFHKFDHEAVAAASIAQVHKAVLHGGEVVAVKILRPNIRIKYNKDIDLLYFIASLINFATKRVKRLKLNDAIAVFEESMNHELDLRLEAAAASKFAHNALNDHILRIPKIYWKFTTEEIMVSEWIDGISIYDIDNISNFDIEPINIVKNIATIFFNQAYRDGFFHADLHPGNILLCPDGKIALLDFGIIGFLEDRDRFYIAEILYNLLKRDYRKVALLHLKAKYIPHDANLIMFEQSCRAAAEPILTMESQEIMIGKLLAQLFEITEKFGMETQPQLLLLQKTMVVVEGVGNLICPMTNMWQLVEPWIKKWATENLSKEAKLCRIFKSQFNSLMSNILDNHSNL